MKKLMIFLISIFILNIFYFGAAVSSIAGFNQGIILIISLIFFLYIIINRELIKRIIPLELGFLLIFILYTLVSGAIVTPNFPTFISREEFMIPATLISIIISFIVGKSNENSDIILKIIVISTVLLSLKLIFNGVEAGYDRITVGVMNVNEVANIINIGFVGIMFLWAESRKSSKIIYFIMAIVQIFAILYTGSRKSFIGILVLLIVYWILKILTKRKINIKKMVLNFFLISMCITLILFITPIIINNTVIGERLLSNDAGDIVRKALYKGSYQLFTEHPFFGVGINGFEYYYGLYSHSTYAELISCTGAFGTLLYISIYLVQWRKLSKILHYSSDVAIISRVQVLRSTIVFMAYLGITMIHFYGMYGYILVGCISGYITRYSTTEYKDIKSAM